LRFAGFAATILAVKPLLSILRRAGAFGMLVLTPACATPTSTATAPGASTASSPAAVTPSAPVLASAAPSAPVASPAPAVDDLVGKPAPDFTATAQDGTPVHLAALKGKRVVLYFYPKDETPGCTKEACSFRDAWQELSTTGAVLIGISADTGASHKDFAAHHKLPFWLVSDPDGKIGAAYGVPFRVYHQRQTILVGADGNVFKTYRQVDVTVHAKQILDDLKHG
jgi:thioredoxin-dependent peroxiredoxin